jgi:PP-loop superfamily ATP-utilizing enzyme
VDDCKNLSDHEALIRRIAQQRRTSSWNLQKISCFIEKIVTNPEINAATKKNFLRHKDYRRKLGHS